MAKYNLLILMFLYVWLITITFPGAGVRTVAPSVHKVYRCGADNVTDWKPTLATIIVIS